MMIDLNIHKYGKYMAALAAAAVFGAVVSGVLGVRETFVSDTPVVKLDSEDVAVPRTEGTEETLHAGEMPWLFQPTMTNGLLEEILSSDKLLAEYRMERQRLRGQETASLQEIITNTEENSEVRAQAAQRLIDRMEQEEKEIRMEYLLKSSGVGDCVVMLEGKDVNILLPRPLSEDEKEKTLENAARIAGVETEKIHLVMRETEEEESGEPDTEKKTGTVFREKE